MKTIWTSRHPLAPEALEALRGAYEEVPGVGDLESREVLWPSEPEDCRRLLEDLLRECDILAGVFPAQAQEAICLGLAGQHETPDFREMFSCPIIPPGRAIISPVSVPETEPEVRKVRPFRFVRWAWMVHT